MKSLDRLYLSKNRQIKAQRKQLLRLCLIGVNGFISYRKWRIQVTQVPESLPGSEFIGMRNTLRS
jgi:hypothetical protein